jgi:hypothetical protein
MAKLKDNVKDLTEVEEKFREAYVKGDDGTFVLDREGSDAPRLKEFREKNLTLEADLKNARAQLGKLKDIDPEKYKDAIAALDKIDQMEEGQLLKAGKLEEVLQKRTENMRSTFDKQLAEKDKAYGTEKKEKETIYGELAKMKIEDLAVTSLNDLGFKIRKGALVDLKARIDRAWTLDDSRKPFAFKNGNHKDPEFGSKGGEPISMPEWLQKTFEDAPHLLEPSQGGGAQGGGKGGASGGPVKDHDGLLENIKEVAKGSKKFEA